MRLGGGWPFTHFVKFFIYSGSKTLRGTCNKLPLEQIDFVPLDSKMLHKGDIVPKNNVNALAWDRVRNRQ